VDGIEVRQVMQDLLDKVQTNYIDEKYDEANKELVGSISKYVGTVNDTSSAQYEEFNKQLKETFGTSMN